MKEKLIKEETITFETILNLIEDVKEELFKRYVAEISFQQKAINDTFYTKIINKIFKLLRLVLEKVFDYTIIRSTRSSYYFNADEKKWAVDFLLYCLKNRDKLAFDLSHFEENDKREIIKFVRNKVYTSLLDEIEIYKLFDSVDLSYWKAYKEIFDGVKRRGDNYFLELGERKYVLPINWFEPLIFYHRYGILELPVKARKSIAGRDVIDAGAFIGDSTLIINELNPRRIYAFEPLEDNVLLLRETIKLNGLRNVLIEKKALGSKEGLFSMFSIGVGSFMHVLGDKEVYMTTVDNYVRRNSLDVALIKMDVEGYELEILRGARETIQEHVPVLLISLYHTGEEFFEAPSLLKSLVPNYKFRFLNLNRMHPTFGRVLVAYST